MKARTSIFVIFLLVSMLFAIPAPVQATKPVELNFDGYLWFTGDDSAEGCFWSDGLFEDGGSWSEVFFITKNGKTIHGVKTLEAEYGTIILKFQAALSVNEETGLLAADGQYTIISGTGAYEKLHGGGVSAATIDLKNGMIYATYTGTGHFD